MDREREKEGEGEGLLNPKFSGRLSGRRLKEELQLSPKAVCWQNKFISPSSGVWEVQHQGTANLVSGEGSAS